MNRNCSFVMLRFLPTTACLRDNHFQYGLNPARCQRMTVSGRTTTSAPLHPAQHRRSRTQKARSDLARRGRGCFCVNVASCCRNARFSRRRSRRERTSPAVSVKRSVNRRNMLHFRIDSLNQSERSNRLIQHVFGVLAKHNVEKALCKGGLSHAMSEFPRRRKWSQHSGHVVRQPRKLLCQRGQLRRLCQQSVVR